MDNVVKHFNHVCRCGNEVEVKIVIKDAGFESSFEGGEETKLEYSFGNLTVEVAQKD